VIYALREFEEIDCIVADSREKNFTVFVDFTKSIKYIISLKLVGSILMY